MTRYFDPFAGLAKSEARSRGDLWTLFPAAALLSFAAWVALMAATGDPAAVVLFVAMFLAAAWKACRWYHQVDDAAANGYSHVEQAPKWWLE